MDFKDNKDFRGMIRFYISFMFWGCESKGLCDQEYCSLNIVYVVLYQKNKFCLCKLSGVEYVMYFKYFIIEGKKCIYLGRRQEKD